MSLIIFLISITTDVCALDSESFYQFRSQLSETPDCFIVPAFSVFNVLKRLKVGKSCGDDLLSNRLLRELAEVLAEPICALINSSIRQGIVPVQWKVARISLIPKVHPPLLIESDLRPISITSSVSKVAECFISRFFNEHFNNFVDRNQFGCTNNRSTTHALIKLSDLFFKASDLSTNFIRILLVDFSKAFDLVDHNVLLQKFINYNFPSHITAWSLSFLQGRSQYVRIGNNSSGVLESHAGTPQGTLSGPNDFKLLINDLLFDLPYFKYVDDTTVVSVSSQPNDCSLQVASNQLCTWCIDNGMKINVKKTKEMLIHFGKGVNNSEIPMLSINNVTVERVTTFKLLGVVFSSDLSWSSHVLYLLNIVYERYYFIFQLVRAGLPSSDIIVIYCSIIRSILEYACPVWHCGLTTSQSADIERVQRRCLKIIFPTLSYREALQISDLEKLCTRRERFVRQLFNDMKDINHVLHSILPIRLSQINSTRNNYIYELPIAKTVRYSNSFVPYCIRKRY
jgi:hypothetical protein